MKTRTKLYAAGAGLALIAAMAWAFAPRPVEVETAQVSQGRFEASLEEDAKTRLRDRYVVSAPLSGRLARISLREGDAVEAGSVLAQLSPVLAPLLDERSLREQQQQVQISLAQLEAAKARAEGARVALLQSKNELQRNEQLAHQGFVSPIKLDTDRFAVQAAQQNFEAAQEQRHMAEHAVEQARAALSAVRSGGGTGRGFALRAPSQGQVLRVLQGSETTVSLGTPLLELGDTSKLEVVAELLSTDALRAQPGSPVVIERWGGPGTLAGRVRAVEPAAFTKVSALGVEEQRVKVLIDLNSPPEQWRALGDGYRVGVRIITQVAEGATLVPVGALFPLKEAPAPTPAAASAATTPPAAPMAVFVLDQGRARLQTVSVVARSGQKAWIREGLKAGDEVIIYPPANVKPGATVQKRRV